MARADVLTSEALPTRGGLLQPHLFRIVIFSWSTSSSCLLRPSTAAMYNEHGLHLRAEQTWSQITEEYSLNR